MPITAVPTTDTPNAGRVKWNDSDTSLQTELDGEQAALVTHKSSSDHDTRYYTESEVNALLTAVGWIIDTYIAAGAITSGKLGAASVIAGKIADDAVVAGNIAANAVDSAAIETGAVGPTELATNAVETAKIANANVTTEKLEYKEFVCTVSQSGTANPVGNTIKNTIGGTPTWTRLASPGLYKLAFGSALLTLTKTIVLIGIGDGSGKVLVSYQMDNSNVFINTVNSTWAYTDALLAETSITIRVYP